MMSNPLAPSATLTELKALVADGSHPELVAPLLEWTTRALLWLLKQELVKAEAQAELQASYEIPSGPLSEMDT